jgi:UDP-N-acetylglucosamine 2-epimerase (non-hydrolysing)
LSQSKAHLKILHPEDLNPRVCVVIGTRPGIVMFSPIIRQLEQSGTDFFVLHTGQHYSENMDGILFNDLALKRPKYRLESVQFCKFHGEQTAEMLKGIEEILLEERPKFVLVGGDANTNLAGALAARKLQLKVGHVEAGERSFDWSMPEEHNRVIIDHISDYLFATGEKSKSNLMREAIRGTVVVSGNPIVDACYQNLEFARGRQAPERFGVTPKQFVLVTLHREENTDHPSRLKSALAATRAVGEELGMPVIMFAHPRTRKRIDDLGFSSEAGKGMRLEEPVGYLDFLDLLASAALVCTDSGGVQQEACILKTPSLTFRDNTEWTETVELGANILVGVDPAAAVEGARIMIRKQGNWNQPFGDGAAAKHIVDAVLNELALTATTVPMTTIER